MTRTANGFLQKSRDLLIGDYLPKIEACLARLGEDDLWWRPNDASNSVGNLVLHLCGNATQWILSGVGGREDERRREEEFDARGGPTRDALLERLRTVVREADAVIATQTDASLAERRRIQGYDVTVLDAIYHVVEHFSMHTGQIVMLTKIRGGADLGLWQPPAG